MNLKCQLELYFKLEWGSQLSISPINSAEWSFMSLETGLFYWLKFQVICSLLKISLNIILKNLKTLKKEKSKIRLNKIREP